MKHEEAGSHDGLGLAPELALVVVIVVSLGFLVLHACA